MIHLVRFYTCLMIVFSVAKFIDASCLSYGHSCWGAHGKRSYNPQRDVKSNDFNHWAALKFPEKADVFPFKKLFRDGSIQQQMRYPNNEVPINFPIVNPQFPLYEEDDADRSLRTIIENSDENEDVQQRLAARLNEDLKPYQTMRLAKQIPNTSQ
ncbi:unnamed protein product [Chironomus riparius]|uniref:Uncharacterized protein n=1 Tax=Chironomus riparius TaxID=315576 RepID=A0A9N9WWX4_9DIPT|nr:unnamed protein product [Chironomus riparius]